MNSSDQLWRQAILSATATIEQAIRNLSEVSIRIVLVTNETGVLEGTISDGDIRRGLLKGLDLDSSIASIIRHNPLVVPPELGRELVKQLMVANKIQQIPIVDDQYKLVGLHLWDGPFPPNSTIIFGVAATRRRRAAGRGELTCLLS